ncbi:MAG: hypothetical protein AAFZ01_03860 [Pseudomonadota bacterium]
MQRFQSLAAAGEHWLARYGVSGGRRPASRVTRAALIRTGELLIRETGLTEPHEHATLLHGRVWYERGQRKMLAPWPTTNRVELYILAHEIGHWMLHGPDVYGCGPVPPIPSYRREYEAERYAREKLRAAGIAVPRDMLRHSKDYVIQHLRVHLRESNEAPDPEIVAWAGFDLEAEHAVVVGQAIARGLPKGDAVRGKPDFRLHVGDGPLSPDTVAWFVAVSKPGHQWAIKALDFLWRAHPQSLPNEFTVRLQHVVDGIALATAAGLRIARG